MGDNYGSEPTVMMCSNTIFVFSSLCKKHQQHKKQLQPLPYIRVEEQPNCNCYLNP